MQAINASSQTAFVVSNTAMKPSNPLVLLISLLLAFPCAAQQIPVNSSIGYEVANLSNSIVLTWESIPTKLYNVLTTTALGQQPWVPLNPSPIYSSNNLVRYRDTNSQPARFYKVVKLDTDPPEIWRLNPGSNATAVARQSPLKAWLRDETAIDPASLVLTVGTNPPATLADPRLAYTDGTLTYTPATNQFLGTNGQTVTATLAYSDTLGHLATNTWPFKLELTPILASNVVLITATSPLTLASTNGDTYVFNYTGASSGLTNGHILVSTDASFPYKRTVLSVTDNPGAHTVSLVTTEASLADILLQGSVHFLGEEAASELQGIQAASDADGITIDLGGKKLYDDNNVLVETVSGRFRFDPDFSISAEFWNPRTFDLEISASMAFDLTMRASWENSWSFSAEKVIDHPVRRFKFLGFVPTPIPIPVWAEMVWEFNIGTEGEVKAQASVTAGFESSAELAFGARYRNGQWTPYSRQIARAVPSPVAWQAAGSGRIRGYMEPKMTILLESLVGPTATLRPYLEIEANACVQPGRAGVDLALYNGIDGTLELNMRGWDHGWGNLPFWNVFNVRSVKPLWHENSSTIIGPQPQTIPNMVWIPCGTFTMGSPNNEADRETSEGPQTRVTISRGFWMGRYEVTQKEYLNVVGRNPSYFNGVRSGVDYGIDLNRPVEMVNWRDAVTYCAILTDLERDSGRLPAGYVYRLPTEAEWEYACRAGTTTAFHYGTFLRAGMANICDYYDYDSSSGSSFNPNFVCLGRPMLGGNYGRNAWGLYDMHGNVSEWCQDYTWTSPLPGGSVTDPQGPATLRHHGVRGGSFDFTGRHAVVCRSAWRGYIDNSTRRFNWLGFRVVLAPSLP